ncbi:MAG: type II secretion system inner membrane protein GspF [Bradymonadales bacterium]|nr:type II secretion system inner membrane protein GspF [Bradymonadales bacterium]
MPVFDYTGLTPSGKRVRGSQDAENPRKLREILKSRGVFLLEHAEGSEDRIGGGTGLRREVDLGQLFRSRISSMELAMLTRQLATLQRAGVPLLESLTAVVEQVDHPRLKRVLSDIRRRVNEGSSFGNALKEHPKVFSDLYVNMVRAGESSGNLDLVLEKLTEFLDSQADLRGKIMSALYYPLVMLVLGTGVLTFLFIYVIPKVTAIFQDQKRALPLLTRILIGFTTFISNPINFLLLVALAVLAVVLFRKWKRTERGHYRWDKLLLKMPIAGPTLRMVAVARFAGTLGTLLASGVPLLSAMDIVKEILANRRLVEVVDQVRTNVREGDSIAAPLKRSGEFPPIVVHMIAIGERTGRLESMLESVSDAYNRQVANRMRALTSLLEPLMIVLMGLIVAFIVFAILVPIMRIGQGFT